MSRDKSLDGPPPHPASADARPKESSSHTVASRRRFLQSSVMAVVGASSALPLTQHADAQTVARDSVGTSGRNGATVNGEGAARPLLDTTGLASRPVTLRLNGRPYALHVEARVTLLDALREHAGLTGTKKGCDRGQCGACTVIANGRRINACMTLAVMHDDEEITTVEGLAENHLPSPLQQAFIEHDAFQCGFCTPGQLCSASALLNELRAGDASAVTHDVRQSQAAVSDVEIRERMSGNICRCGAYPNIVAAIRSVVVRQG